MKHNDVHFLRGARLDEQDIELEFTRPVTFIIGESGSGQSTLLEALAER